MTKEELINELLRQQLGEKSLVRIVVSGQQLIGNLTDAKVKNPDEKCEYHLIGLVLKATPGMVVAKYPMPVAVEMIDSIEGF